MNHCFAKDDCYDFYFSCKPTSDYNENSLQPLECTMQMFAQTLHDEVHNLKENW